MFKKGIMKTQGDININVTIKGNPNHFLSPDDWDMVLGVKFGKISTEEYKHYYKELLKKRWETRKQEFIDLAKQGKDKTIILRCYCPMKDKFCHAYVAADFMNKLMEKV